MNKLIEKDKKFLFKHLSEMFSKYKKFKEFKKYVISTLNIFEKHWKEMEKEKEKEKL